MGVIYFLLTTGPFARVWETTYLGLSALGPRPAEGERRASAAGQGQAPGLGTAAHRDARAPAARQSV